MLHMLFPVIKFLGVFACGGMCTLEQQSLKDGLVIDCVIACLLHGGRINVRKETTLSASADVDLKI